MRKVSSEPRQASSAISAARGGRFSVLPVLLALCALGAEGVAQVSYTKPLARVVRNEDGTRLSTKVDPHNQTVEEILSDSKGGVLWKLVRELDEAFQPLKATKYDGQNRILSRHRYLCIRGRVEEEEVLDAKEALVGRLVFYYDTKGRMSRIEQFNAAGVLLTTARSSQGRGVDPVVREFPAEAVPTPRIAPRAQPR
jgi:hypothetical protein